VKEHLPRIIDEKKQFEPASPLHRIVEIVLPIVVGHDAAAVRIAVADHGFLGTGRADGVELPQHVGGDGHRLRNITWPTSTVTFGAGIDRRGKGGGAGRKAMPAFIAIGIELKMREMQRLSLGCRDCCDRFETLPGMPRLLQCRCTGCGL